MRNYKRVIVLLSILCTVSNAGWFDAITNTIIGETDSKEERIRKNKEILANIK